MNTGQATGLQIAILLFAVMLLSAPLGGYLASVVSWPPEWKGFLRGALHFAVAIALFASVPQLRRYAARELSRPIGAEHAAEVAVAVIVDASILFALAGAVALWYWMQGGGSALEARMAAQRPDALEAAYAFSPAGMARMLVIGGIVAPILEELVFRGLLLGALERRWGWPRAMLATSVLFGLYHPYFLSAFASSIVFACVLRRTGSLRAPIVVHAVLNLMLWYPFLGRHAFPSRESPWGELATWSLQLACLAFAAIAIPAYAWLARGAQPARPR